MDNLIALIVSFTAIAFSVFSIFHNRRVIMTSVITKQRIEWITSLRAAVSNLVSAHLNSDTFATIMEKKIQVELLLNYENEAHSDLFKSLNEFIVNKGDRDKKMKNLVAETQNLIKVSWRRMKSEAHMSKKFEKKRDAEIPRT